MVRAFTSLHLSWNSCDYCKQEQNTLWDESRRFVNPQKVYVDLSQSLYDMKKALLEEMSEKEL